MKTVQFPVCDAEVDVDYQILDATSWVALSDTAHITDRYLFRERLDRGETFWTAQKAKRIVSYCWTTHKAVEIGEIRSTIRPRPDEVYLYDAFTFEAHRGRNLCPALLYRILEYSRAAGLRRALISVVSDNTTSIRSVQKAGFVEFQRVSYLTEIGNEQSTYEPLLSELDMIDLISS